jgi:hypothetical protein
MFVQVIQGQVADAEELHAAIDRWAQELAPGASGWLGTTAGVTEDGRSIALVRFETEEAARQNSDRAEQDQWWSETSKLFSGEVTFHDSTQVEVDTPGDPGQAGFVQVMQGRTSDPKRSRELMQMEPDDWAKYRPDVLGSLAAEYDDGGYTTAIYFTSEAEAREGEQKEPPPEFASAMEEMNSLNVGEVDFFDIKQPWLYAPK